MIIKSPMICFEDKVRGVYMFVGDIDDEDKPWDKNPEDEEPEDENPEDETPEDEE